MIGDLRLRIGLERPEASPAGGVAFVSVGGAWAAHDDESGARHRFAIRRRADVRPGWRVAWEGRRLRVLAVLDGDDRGARLDLVCEEELP
jgi:head-tail adaptor